MRKIIGVVVFGLFVLFIFFLCFNATPATETESTVSNPTENLPPNYAAPAQRAIGFSEDEYKELINALGSERLVHEYIFKTGKMIPGTILITPESSKVFIGDTIRFGHAAIVGPSGDKVIEAPGMKEKIREVPLSKWIKRYKMWTAYVVKGATMEQRVDAAKYALRQVQEGKGYVKTVRGLLYDKKSEEAFYCSSLVWRAWWEASDGKIDIDYNDNQAVNWRDDPTISNLSLLDFARYLDYNKFYETVFPVEIIKDPSVVPIAQSVDANWYPITEAKLSFKNEFAYIGLGWKDIRKAEVYQSKGHHYELYVVKNESSASAKIWFEKANGEIINRNLSPGETVDGQHFDTPAGNHVWHIECSKRKKCKIQAMIRSVE
ncbi:YiiX/YebB-like N1pC/P60 family cysteine hydrolase [Thermoactinomyces sp. CICC 10521]|uniref:YiiX/YebB-like N1pC/P60 family cysteine hydrolase n=1 Tax=Thermoactinomyces sp. CICC 10521 TaxID=2767426 RepID=UPI0018DD4E10|nr:YiiX/YebB-like N1pC/P60 family cysteine hydrolase [Thermoactinomyces sp. CICC 10521]MBH8608880.1 hypothetical protein [Thermoactinomyces sp. CICC 10521]